MNKDYMLRAVIERLEALKEQYRLAVRGISSTGKELSGVSLRVTRSRIKRDICILELVYELLLTSEAVFIENEDAILGFDKLIGE